MAETNLRRGLMLSDNNFMGFITNPLSGAFLLIALLAMIVHTGAAAPGEIAALYTHWIWQEGCERLTIESPEIIDGKISVDGRPGLGIAPDMERIEAAYALYLEHGLGARNDAAAMQYLIPGWKFDNKKPCLIR